MNSYYTWFGHATTHTNAFSISYSNVNVLDDRSFYSHGDIVLVWDSKITEMNFTWFWIVAHVWSAPYGRGRKHSVHTRRPLC